jgi:hypothetical protein
VKLPIFPDFTGTVPAGEMCSYLDVCGLKTEKCPGIDGKTRDVNFSCAAARSWTLIFPPKDGK